MRIVEPTPGVFTKIALSAVLIAAAIAMLQLTPSPRPEYRMVDEVVKNPRRYEGNELRVHGWIVAGSIVRYAERSVAFTLQKEGRRLRVWHDGPLPDTVRDQSELVALGMLENGAAEGWVFQSTQLMAKCGGKYDGSPPRQTNFQ